MYKTRTLWNLIEEKNQAESNKKYNETIPLTITPTPTKTERKMAESQEMLTHPVGQVEQRATSTKNTNSKPMQHIECVPGTKYRQDQTRSNGVRPRTTKKRTSRLQLKLYIKPPGLDFGGATEGQRPPKNTSNIPGGRVAATSGDIRGNIQLSF